MRQLVGLSCVVCGKAVTSILEGRFCRSCSCPVHNQCARLAVERGIVAGCSDCGATPEQVQAEKALDDLMHAASGPQTWGDVFWCAIDTCLAAPGLFLSGLVAIFLIVACVVIVISSSLSGRLPESIYGLAVFGIVLLTLKLAVLGFLFYPVWRRVLARREAEILETQVRDYSEQRAR